jgi:hypothetical protein
VKVAEDSKLEVLKSWLGKKTEKACKKTSARWPLATSCEERLE